MIRVSLFIFVLVYSLAGFSQDFKKQYKQAKRLFEDGEFSKAMDAFQPLTVYDRENPYPEYASFYYALSAQNLGYAIMAKDMFLQIKKIYPSWEQIDEVNYCLTKLYLDEREYFHALALSREIQNPDFKKDIVALERKALMNISDVETLKMLLEENKTDMEVARSLAYAIGRNTADTDAKYLDSISQVFGFHPSDFIVIKKPKSEFKIKYQVALLLPFMSNSLDPGPGKKKSQFVLDLYQGMKLAADTLAMQGVFIDILAYDTEHDQSVINELLKKDELKTVDLIVGPLFAEDAPLIQEFSKKYEINLVVNPVSSNSELVSQNPFSFLFQPSNSTFGLKSAEFLSTNTYNKNCLVYYGDTPKDSTAAANFVSRGTELGLKILKSEKVNSESSTKILDVLTAVDEYDEWKKVKEFKVKRDSIGSIFVASDNALIYTKVVNSVETRGDSTMVIGNETWIEDTSIDLTKLERIRIFFTAPNFSSPIGSEFQSFRKKYLFWHGVMPSAYAQKGFEFMIVIGRAFKQYGNYFQDGLQQNGVPGFLTRGYKMQPTRDNGLVTFISFKRGILAD